MIIVVISVAFMILLPSELPAAYIFTWIMLLMTVLPFSLLGLLAVMKRNDENWAQKVESLRNAAARGYTARPKAKPKSLTTTV